MNITDKTTPFRVAQCVFASVIENVTTLKRLRKQPKGYEQKNMTSYLLPWGQLEREMTDIKSELEQNIANIIEETSHNLSEGAEELYTIYIEKIN